MFDFIHFDGMKDTQNTSHAVMSQRFEPQSSLDDFPTPPWATRALIEKIIGPETVEGKHCWEPACGRGYMARPLMEYFGSVYSSDVHSYGAGDVIDFLQASKPAQEVDWIITNPPFKAAEDFVNQALSIASSGVAILARTVFLESIGRYERIFKRRPPAIFAQFSERVPMVKGRVDPKASTATGYAWFIWLQEENTSTRLEWLPPCRKLLERQGDYD